MCSTSNAEVHALLEALDGSESDQAYDARGRLRELLGDDLPNYLLARYRSQRHWRRRTDYVYEALRYARRSEEAVNLGKLAVSDRSKMVRHRACALLAYSLRRDLLPFLEEELAKAKDGETRDDIVAAMDAIVEQNHHYFVDRNHTGDWTWNVE